VNRVKSPDADADHTTIRNAFYVLRQCLPPELGVGAAEAVLDVLEEQFIRGRVPVPEWICMLRVECTAGPRLRP
jgi:hypothetical protein